MTLMQVLNDALSYYGNNLFIPQPILDHLIFYWRGLYYYWKVMKRLGSEYMSLKYSNYNENDLKLYINKYLLITLRDEYGGYYNIPIGLLMVLGFDLSNNMNVIGIAPQIKRLFESNRNNKTLPDDLLDVPEDTEDMIKSAQR